MGIKFDINDGDFVFGNDKFGFDTNGHFMTKIGKNTMLDTEKGEIHFVVGDSNDEDKNKSLKLEDDDK